jgi:hypothetical protein
MAEQEFWDIAPWSSIVSMKTTLGGRMPTARSAREAGTAAQNAFEKGRNSGGFERRRSIRCSLTAQEF